MIDMDESGPAVPGQPALGADLSNLSVYELEARLDMLQQERERTEIAIRSRHESKDAANAIFGDSKSNQ